MTLLIGFASLLLIVWLPIFFQVFMRRTGAADFADKRLDCQCPERSSVWYVCHISTFPFGADSWQVSIFYLVSV
jgi:hypothetical protein